MDGRIVGHHGLLDVELLALLGLLTVLCDAEEVDAGAGEHETEEDSGDERRDDQPGVHCGTFRWGSLLETMFPMRKT